jgi:hypothetical protein
MAGEFTGLIARGFAHHLQFKPQGNEPPHARAVSLRCYSGVLPAHREAKQVEHCLSIVYGMGTHELIRRPAT